MVHSRQKRTGSIASSPLWMRTGSTRYSNSLQCSSSGLRPMTLSSLRSTMLGAGSGGLEREVLCSSGSDSSSSDRVTEVVCPDNTPADFLAPITQALMARTWLYASWIDVSGAPCSVDHVVSEWHWVMLAWNRVHCAVVSGSKELGAAAEWMLAELVNGSDIAMTTINISTTCQIRNAYKDKEGGQLMWQLSRECDLRYPSAQ